MGFLKAVGAVAVKAVKTIGDGLILAAGIYATYRGYNFLKDNMPKVEAKGKEGIKAGWETVKGFWKKKDNPETTEEAAAE